MTDNNAVVLRSRQAVTAPARSPQGPSDALIEKAKMVAAARDLLPRHYAGNPGAVMMALDWAERNDVSIFEAIGEVAFVHGRPVVSGRLQKRMAARAGYTTRKTAGDAQSCTVAVYGPDGQFIDDFTYTIEMAHALGLVKGQVWKADPAQMLYWRALTRALEQFGPGEMATTFVEPGPADGGLDVDLLDPAPAAPQAAPVPDPDPTPAGVPEITEASLRAALKAKGLKISPALQAVQQVHEGDGLGTLSDIAKHPEAGPWLNGWIENQ